jgi:uncharacterized protein (DUF1697 family)
MGVIIALLRGVNVGGHNKIKMDALRAFCESLNLRDACTYVQSGNVVFRSGAKDLVRLGKRLEDAIEQGFGFRPAVILRTAPELRDVIARNPFAKRGGVDPKKLLVTFMAAEPSQEARDKALQIKAGLDELRIDGREIYIYFPNGMGRPTLSPAAVERTLKTPGTGRNWNSVTNLLEIAERLEAS